MKFTTNNCLLSQLRQSLKESLESVPSEDKPLALEIAETVEEENMTLEDFRDIYKYLKTPEIKKNRVYLIPVLIFGEGVILGKQQGIYNTQ